MLLLYIIHRPTYKTLRSRTFLFAFLVTHDQTLDRLAAPDMAVDYLQTVGLRDTAIANSVSFH